jgi:xylulokinase
VKKYVIGCDIGSQGVKAILLSTDGQVRAEAQAAYDIHYPRPLWAEQPVESWLNGLAQVIKAVSAAVQAATEQICAIGLAAQVDGLVALDRAGQPLRAAIIWMDRRADRECAELAGAQPSPCPISGLNLDPSHVAPKIRWLARNEPEVYGAAAHFLLPGSYVAYHLTGELAVDYSNASSTLLMDLRRRDWSKELCARFGVELDHLAPIHPATEVLGRLRPAVAKELGLSEQTLVMVGCGDEHAACLGAGVVQPGLVGDIIGTAEPVCAASRDLLFDPTGLVETHCHADSALWLLENPGFVSGANYRWFCEQFAPLERQAASERGISPYALIDEAAAAVPAGSEGLILLPCLMGAMTPTWNPAARGTFFGFTLAHTRNHFARAILEGSAYAVRDILDQMRRVGLPLRELRVMGGGARSRLWRQIKADVTGLPVVLPESVETTALGAAMLALVGSGEYATLTEAAERIVRLVETVQPQPKVASRYEEYYRLYRDAYFALLPVFERAARLSQ